MKTVFNFIKLTILGGFTFFMSNSVNSQTLESQLNLALNNSYSPSITYEEVEYERVKVLYPTGLNGALDSVLQRYVSEDSDISNLCEEGSYYIKYELKALSSNFISIEKTRASNFCKYIDDIEYSTINLIIGTDGTVYQIKASGNQIITVVNNYEFQETDCNDSGNRIFGHLLFMNKRRRMLIVKTKACKEYVNLQEGTLIFDPVE